MPAYEYRCTSCAKEFEVVRPMGGAGAECCPECGEEAKRVFAPVGVAFKGTGFHNTDYRPRPKESSSESTSSGGDSAPCPVTSKDSPACASCPAANE